MSGKIRPSEIKLVTTLAKQVKDASASGSKTYVWNNLYRIVSADGGLSFYANDGVTWLVWNFHMEEPTQDDYDVVLTASNFNETAAKMEEGDAYEVVDKGSQLGFLRGSQELWVSKETPVSYPSSKKAEELFEEQSFSVDVGILRKNLRFAAPFIDFGNAMPARKVGTWDTDGTLIGGSNRQIVKIKGMPFPPLSMSFRKKLMQSVVAFLSSLSGDVVDIILTGNRYIFRCPLYWHVLDIGSESERFPQALVDLGDQVPEIIRFDGQALMKSVGVVNTTLPAEADRLLVTVKGSGETAMMGIKAAGDPSLKGSCDAFSIIRVPGGDGADQGDIQFAVNCRIFEDVLKEMDGVILEGRCYMEEGRRRFVIEDERSNDDDTYRSVLLPVDLNIEEDQGDDDPGVDNKKKVGKKATLSKP